MSMGNITRTSPISTHIAAPGRSVVPETDETMVSLGVAADVAAPFKPAIGVARINSAGVHWLLAQKMPLRAELQAGTSWARDESLSRGNQPVDATMLRSAILLGGLRSDAAL